MIRVSLLQREQKPSHRLWRWFQRHFEKVEETIFYTNVYAKEAALGQNPYCVVYVIKEEVLVTVGVGPNPILIMDEMILKIEKQ